VIAVDTGLLLLRLLIGVLMAAHGAQKAGGYEYPLVLAGAALALAVTGPGRFSVDHLAGWILAPAVGARSRWLSAFSAGWPVRPRVRQASPGCSTAGRKPYGTAP
jgi:hypothetical protein